MLEKKVTVVMPIYNAKRFLEEAIESVVHQTYENWELLLVDDCSKDGSLEIARRYEQEDRRIRVIANEQNQGVAMSRNTGIKEAKGEYIALLDSDDVWVSTKLEKQIALIMEKNATIVYCSYDFIDESGKPILKPYIVPECTNFEKMLVSSVMSCSTVLIEAEFFKKHLFKKEFYHEDYVLWMEMLKEKIDVVGLSDVYAHYRKVSGSRSDNKINAAKQRWKVFREDLKLPLWKSFIAFVGYAVNGITKYYLNR